MAAFGIICQRVWIGPKVQASRAAANRVPTSGRDESIRPNLIRYEVLIVKDSVKSLSCPEGIIPYALKNSARNVHIGTSKLVSTMEILTGTERIQKLCVRWLEHKVCPCVEASQTVACCRGSPIECYVCVRFSLML